MSISGDCMAFAPIGCHIDFLPHFADVCAGWGSRRATPIRTRKGTKRGNVMKSFTIRRRIAYSCVFVSVLSACGSEPVDATQASGGDAAGSAGKDAYAEADLPWSSDTAVSDPLAGAETPFAKSRVSGEISRSARWQSFG